MPESRRKVFVIGESGIERELESEGIPVVGGTDPAFNRRMESADYVGIANGTLLDPEVGVVLVGLDLQVNYLKLSMGYHYLRRGAVFLATNVDSTFPHSGTLFPGAGTMSNPLVKMIGKEPVALGKPSQAMMEAIKGKFHFQPERTCMVGDRINTDIRFGVEGALGGTLGVLTGVSSKDDFFTSSIRPTAYVDKLADLLAARTS